MSTKKEHTVKRILSTKIEELSIAQNKRLDEIEKFVKEDLKRINDRNKAINGYVLGEVKNLMDTQLYNIQLTSEALKELIIEHNLIPELRTKLDEKRSELHKARQDAAVSKMQENLQGEAQPAETSKSETTIQE